MLYMLRKNYKYLHVPRGAEWMIRGAYTACLSFFFSTLWKMQVGFCFLTESLIHSAVRVWMLYHKLYFEFKDLDRDDQNITFSKKYTTKSGEFEDQKHPCYTGPFTPPLEGRGFLGQVDFLIFWAIFSRFLFSSLICTNLVYSSSVGQWVLQGMVASLAHVKYWHLRSSGRPTRWAPTSL